jgi:hypothetical protein
MTLQEEKERIDYEIEAKRKAREKEISEWNTVGCLFLIAFFVIVLITKCAS